MYARMTIAQLQPIEPHVVIPLPMGILRELREQPGLADLLVLTSHAESKVVLISLWKTEAEMQSYEASPAYQQHMAKLGAVFVEPPIQISYDSSFNITHLSGVAYTAITSASVFAPDQPKAMPPAQQPTIGQPDQIGTQSGFSFARSRPVPAQAELLRVIPIARQAVHDGVAIMLLSLESYADSFIVQGRLRIEQEAPSRPSIHRFPELHSLEARDDRGNRYRSHQQGGGGSTRDWRFSFALTPALDPAAHELHIEIAELPWRRFDRNAPERQHEREVQPGPWAFTIPLPSEEA